MVHLQGGGGCKGVGKDIIFVSNQHQCTNQIFYIKSAWLDMMSFFYSMSVPSRDGFQFAKPSNTFLKIMIFIFFKSEVYCKCHMTLSTVVPKFWSIPQFIKGHVIRVCMQRDSENFS